MDAQQHVLVYVKAYVRMIVLAVAGQLVTKLVQSIV